MVGPTRTARVTTQSLAVILCLMPGLGPQRGSDGRVQAQETIGSTEATVAGAAMGLYAGGALGGLASLVPCNQTMAGISCVRTVAVLGAGIGLASGVTLGREDSDAIWTAPCTRAAMPTSSWPGFVRKRRPVAGVKGTATCSLG